MRLEAVVLLVCVTLCIATSRREERFTSRKEDRRLNRRSRSVMRDIHTVGELRREQRRRRTNAVEDDPLETMRRKSTEGATISEMFSLCDPVTWRQFEKKQHSNSRTRMHAPHLEEIHHVKCEVYSRLHQCVEGATLPANTWSCMRAHCGEEHLTHLIERASRDHRKNTCRDVTTDDGKIRCVFERLHTARSCGELRDVCDGHPYHEGAGADVCGAPRSRAGRQRLGERTGEEEEETAQGAWPHGRRMKRDLSRAARSPRLNQGRLLHRKVHQSQWPDKFYR